MDSNVLFSENNNMISTDEASFMFFTISSIEKIIKKIFDVYWSAIGDSHLKMHRRNDNYIIFRIEFKVPMDNGFMTQTNLVQIFSKIMQHKLHNFILRQNFYKNFLIKITCTCMYVILIW